MESQKINEGKAIDKKEYITNWLTEARFNETSSETDSTVCSSSLIDSEDLSNEIKHLNIGNNVQTTTTENTLPDANSISSNTTFNQTDFLQNVFNKANSIQTLGNISIEKSSGVHIGNITYITGPIHITQTSGGNIGTVYQTDNGNNEAKKAATPKFESSNDTEGIEINSSESFIGNIERSYDTNILKIIDRRTWLAQKPLEAYELLQTPVPYVIISHTATESGTTQADNIFLIRNIQCFHIESRRWNDIGYNFVIGCDGSVYEGRGWTAVGAHAYGHNKRSIGISFVGCFMRELPPPASINACKLLIKRGVELGYIMPNYKLFAHCQVSATESPGRMFYENIKTWENFATNL